MNKLIDPYCITPHLAGGMGNVMFMIAHAYAEALRMNKQLIISTCPANPITLYGETIFRKVDKYICFPEDTPAFARFAGYYQDEKYFKNYSEAVKQLFSPSENFIKEVKQNSPFMFEKNITAISVRRGDYLIYSDFHPVISLEYIMKAIELLPTASHYVVFSDDIEWCKENIHLPNLHFVDRSPDIQMWMMSLCDNFIISNSSFSWWGAYLSRNKEKKVVCPLTWFGPRGPKTWDGIYCKDWIIMPTYYKDGFIYPK